MSKECIELISNFITIIGLPLAIIGIIAGKIQIELYRKVEEARFWIELREVFRNHNYVHLNLRNGGKWTKKNKGPTNLEDWASVDAYLGQFELCQTMLSKKLIDKETFKSQYDYRIQNIIQNEKIKAKILSEKDQWTHFITLCNILEYKLM